MNLILFFLILSTEKSFEMFPRHKGVATISESFALNLWTSVPLTVCSTIMQTKTKFFIIFSKIN